MSLGDPYNMSPPARTHMQLLWMLAGSVYVH